MAALLRLLLIFWVGICYGQSQTPGTGMMTIDPSMIRLTPDTISTGPRLSMTCERPSGVDVSVLVVMRIMKKESSSKPWDGSVLVASPKDKEAKIVDKNTLKNVTLSGSTVNQKISLTLYQARCDSGGIYICSISYLDAQFNTAILYQQAPVTVEVDAAQNLSMSVSPERPLYTEVWKVADKLSMTCLGAVGSVNTDGGNSDPPIAWIWQYKYRGFPDSSWTIYGNDNDIKESGFLKTSSNCYKNQTSTLTRNLTLDDSGREYRCFVRRGTHEKVEFAASYFIGTVTADGKYPDVEAPSETSRASVGAIVGGVLGALLFIAVVIIIVYFVVIRPRRRKQDDEKEDGNAEKGDDVDTPPAYATDPSVIYSQPKRRGKDKRWDDKDRAEGARDAEGLHYADLDLVRNPPQDRSNRSAPPTPSTPTEYASIRLF